MEEVVHRFGSFHLGNERPIWIREPREPSKPFNLVIFLDAELYRDQVGAVSIIEDLQATNGIDDSLIVFVSMQSIEARWKECPCYPPFAAFVNGELVPWLESRYPSLTTNGERVLIGLSYTGLAAAFVASAPASKFSRVIAQSGSFWWNHCWAVEYFRTIGHRIPASFYLDVGSSETATNVRHRDDVLQVVSQIDAVRQLKDVLVSGGTHVKYVEFSGGHDFAAWKKTLPDALQWALPPRD